MSRSKSRDPARRSGKQPTRWQLPPNALWRIWATVGWCGVFVLAAWGLQVLEQRVDAARAEVPCHLEWCDLPAWLETDGNRWVLEEIENAAAPVEATHLHDPELCADVGTRLGASPWVAEVRRVEKRPNGTIAIEADFREPLALVESGGWAYLVDRDGVRLPLDYAPDFVEPNSPLLIVGAQGPIPDLGKAWPGADLAAGLKLARYLQQAHAAGRLPFRADLRAIDVANYNRDKNAFDGRLRLRTVDPRCYINWGEPPGEEYSVEATAGRKLDLLRTYYLDRGRAFPSGVIVEVRNGEGIQTRPYRGT